MFFTRTDVAELNNSVGEMQKKYGTCKSVRMAEAFNNTCDKWDCPIKCYCAQSEKDSFLAVDVARVEYN